MKQSEVKDFCEYEVYEYRKIAENARGIEKHTICLCKEYKCAKVIACTLAQLDPDNDAYYVTNVSIPNTLVPGGGWYDRFQKGEDGKVHQSSLS